MFYDGLYILGSPGLKKKVTKCNFIRIVKLLNMIAHYRTGTQQIRDICEVSGKTDGNYKLQQSRNQ